jgi:hypothetical protein
MKKMARKMAKEGAGTLPAKKEREHSQPSALAVQDQKKRCDYSTNPP